MRNTREFYIYDFANEMEYRMQMIGLNEVIE